MASQVYVHDFSYALGEDSFDVEESAAAGRTRTEAKALRNVGFARHHVCHDETTPYELAKRAVEPLRDRLEQGVELIVYSTCLPLNANLGSTQSFERSRDVKDIMDFPASHLQADFGLDRAWVLGLNQQACTSMLGSLRVAGALLDTDPDLKRALCVTADRFPKGALYEQAYNLISDGAGACLVSRERTGYRLVTAHGITNGALAQASDDETVGSYFNYTHRLIMETLARASLRMDDIDWVVPQNTNQIAWQILCRLLKFDYERVFYPSMTDVGHIISSDNVVNMARLEKERVVRPGSRLLLVMAGFGLNWQAVILEKV
jgi:3-oxoacyl-[acyl-carrier-protein] synthase-3